MYHLSRFGLLLPGNKKEYLRPAINWFRNYYTRNLPILIVQNWRTLIEQTHANCRLPVQRRDKNLIRRAIAFGETNGSNGYHTFDCRGKVLLLFFYSDPCAPQCVNRLHVWPTGYDSIPKPCMPHVPRYVRARSRRVLRCLNGLVLFASPPPNLFARTP